MTEHVTDDEPRSGQPYRFEGLESMDGTLFPNVLLDHVMAHLSGAEFKVLAYIVRRTIGLRRASDAISLEQICHGVRDREGRVLDAGTGLSKKTAITAIKGLQDKGIIVVNHGTARGRGTLPGAFSLRLKHVPEGANRDDLSKQAPSDDHHNV